MPIPKPEKDEMQDEFMDKCMSDGTMHDEYPDEKQRYAVCLSSWKEEKQSSNKPVPEGINRGMESRTFNFSLEDIESRKSDTPIIKGHAAVFEEKTSIPFWGFDEMVGRNAFTETIKKDDIRALFNHDANYVLGRNMAGTLKLKEDDRGLAIEIDPPDTQFAKDLMHLMDRGDINQMSFAFQVEKEGWEKGEDKEADLRILERVKLYDISVVTFPAYEGTDVGLRSYNRWLSEIKKDSVFYKVELLKRRLSLIQKEGGQLNGKAK